MKLFFILLLWGSLAQAQILDNPTTLRNWQPYAEEEYHSWVAEGIAPADFAQLNSLEPLNDKTAHQLISNRSSGQIAVQFQMAGQNWARASGDVQTFEGTTQIQAKRGPLSARANIRLFAEKGLSGPLGIDGEFADEQSANAAGQYRSYGRYRAQATLQTDWGQWQVAHDALRWGPALRSNLLFNGSAIPFDRLSYQHAFGPIQLQSIYGRLNTHAHDNTDSAAAVRRVYAHRYVWSTPWNWTLGINEQLILIHAEQPFLFTPIFPLFLGKSLVPEYAGNGSLSVDLSYPLPGGTLVYGEFYLDDMESPFSLFTRSYAQNKWGWNTGLHHSHAWGPFALGQWIEFAALQPYSYSHFKVEAAQATHAGAPLGLQQGPDVFWATAKAYARTGPWYLGIEVEREESGTGPGSSLDDLTPWDNQIDGQKEFLRNSVVHWNTKAEFAFGTQRFSGFLAWGWGKESGLSTRLETRF